MTKSGRPIYLQDIKHKYETGINYGSWPGIVPPFIEHEACIAANYRYFHDWQELSGAQKADIVSHYYLKNLVEGHKQDTLTDEMERKAKKTKGKGKK